MANTNPGLPYIADTDIADTLALAGVKSFEDGGSTDTPAEPVDEGTNAYDENARTPAAPAPPAETPRASDEWREMTPAEVQGKGLNPQGPQAETPADDWREMTPDEVQAKGLNPHGPQADTPAD